MIKRNIVPAVLTLFLGACMTGQDYTRPAVEVPANFRYAIDAGSQAAMSAASQRWWEQFNDPVLSEMIQTALAQNLDLRIATTRLLEYQAIRVVSGAPLLPQVTLPVTETRTSQGNAPITDVFQGGLSLAWELDFWGRIRRLSEAAQADLLGQEQARRAVVLSLVSAVATSYIQLRELDARLEIAVRTRTTREEAQRLAKVRYQVGTVSELELKQANAEYQGTVVSVRQLEQAVAQKENELSLLLGRNPAAVKRGRSLEALAAPAIPAGLPSELLTRRPDIVQAEQVLIGANARVGAAQASLFPTISLTGNYGGASTQLAQLFTGANRIWSFVPSVSVPIFNAGSLAAQVTVSEARREQALDGYRKAIQAAFRDTEDALIGVTKAGEQKAAQAALVEEVRRYAHLARLRYENGVTSNLEVLDSQRSLFTAEQTLVQAQSAALVATVNLYKALGGDWGVDNPPVMANPRSGQ